MLSWPNPAPAFVSPSSFIFRSRPRALKYVRPGPNWQPGALQLRASLNASKEALFDYVSDKTSGAPRDQSRVRVLLNHVGQGVENAWLLVAARVGDGAMVKQLLDNGADPNVGDIEGSTPLMRAVSRGHVDAARVLLDDERVDVSKQNGKRARHGDVYKS
ncbi:hypothetical protein FGB62_127g11 [Gracilaria domingensis]|nr:hypothetical protein FGB62_127g11 [Gracilaria domingensis]